MHLEMSAKMAAILSRGDDRVNRNRKLAEWPPVLSNFLNRLSNPDHCLLTGATKAGGVFLPWHGCHCWRQRQPPAAPGTRQRSTATSHCQHAISWNGKHREWPSDTIWRGLVTPYVDTDLGQHWLRQWLVAWGHQTITWTNLDLSSVRSGSRFLMSISQEKTQTSVTKISSKIT